MRLRKTFLAFVYISCLVIFSCCQESTSSPLLVEADSLLAISPEKSLQKLKQIDISNLHSNYEKAYYSLLLVQATDKNYLSLLPCDSLINVCTEYFYSGLNKGKSYLYKGRLLVEMGMEREAIDFFYKALPELKNGKSEIRIRGMIYEDLGRVYYSQSLYNEALDKFNLACNDYMSINDKKAIVNALGFISRVYAIQNKNKDEIRVMTQAIKLAFETKDSLVISNTCNNYSMTYESLNKIDSALQYAFLALSYRPFNVKKSPIYLSIGNLKLLNSEIDSARYYLNKSFEDGTVKDHALTHGYLSDLEKGQGNFQEAFEHLTVFSEVIDSLYMVDKSSQIEQMGYKYEIEAKVASHKASMRLTIIAIVFVSIIIVLMLLLVLQRLNKKKTIAKLLYKQRSEKMLMEIANLQTRIDQNNLQIQCLEKEQLDWDFKIEEKMREVQELAKQKNKLRNALFQQTSSYTKIQKLSKQDRSDNKSIKVLTQAEQIELRKTIFQIYEESVAELQEKFPKLTEDDLLYSCLEQTGLDTFAIALCFGNASKQIVNQRRYRLKAKMIIEE